MSKLLDEAFSAAARLSVEEQDAFARFILEELRSEARWAQAFASSQDELAGLAQEAAADYKAGRTKPL
jgi:hypothetical protein